MKFPLMLTTLLVVFCQALSWGQEPEVFNVAEAVAYGLNHHRRISSEEENLEYRQWLTREGKSDYLPSVKASADYRYNIDLPVTILPSEAFGEQGNGPLEIQMGTRNALQGGIDLEQVIYNPVIVSRVKEQEIRHQMAGVSVSATRKSVALEIRRSYYQAVLHAEVWQTSQLILDNYKALEESVKVQFENGLVNENEFQTIKHRRQNQGEQVSINEMRYRNSIQQLKMAMDYPRDKNLAIKDSLVLSLVDLTPLLQPDSPAYRQLPDYRDLSLQENLTQARITTLGRQYHPRVAAYGYFGTQYYDDAFSPIANDHRWYRHSYLGLRVNISLFQGLGRNYRKQALHIRAGMLAQRRTKLVNDLKRRESILRENFSIASKQALQKQNDYTHSRDNFTLMIDSFENGLTGFDNVLRSETDMLVQYQAYLNAMTEVLNASLQYEQELAVY